MEDVHLRHGINRLVARYVSRDTRLTGLKESPKDAARIKRHSAAAGSYSAVAAAAAADAEGLESAADDDDSANNPTLLSELLQQREELMHAQETLSRRVAYLSRTKEALVHTAVRENSALLELNNEYRRELQLHKQKEAAQAAAAALAERQSHVQGAARGMSSSSSLIRGSHETSTSQNITLATPMLRKGAPAGAAHVRPGRLSASASQPLLPSLGMSTRAGSHAGAVYDAVPVSASGSDAVHSSQSARRLAALTQLASSVEQVVGLLPPSVFADRVVPTQPVTGLERSSTSTAHRGESRASVTGLGGLGGVPADASAELGPALTIKALSGPAVSGWGPGPVASTAGRPLSVFSTGVTETGVYDLEAGT